MCLLRARVGRREGSRRRGGGAGAGGAWVGSVLVTGGSLTQGWDLALLHAAFIWSCQQLSEGCLSETAGPCSELHSWSVISQDSCMGSASFLQPL